ncbi:MAG: hypothetical protein ACRC9Q_06495 [Bacteroidales bacterium]
MKKSLLILMMAILSLSVFISCDDDGYSLGEFQISPATVKVISPGSYYLQLDNGEKLWPAAQEFHYNPTSDTRVWANFTLLSDEQDGYDHYVKVNALSKILTKDAIEITNAQEDSVGNNKARIRDVWFAEKYISIVFACYSRPGAVHLLNLVHNKDTQYPQDGKVYLEFRQNNFGIQETNSMSGSVSFDVSKYLPEDQDEVTFVITSNDFDGAKKYELKLIKEDDVLKISSQTLSGFSERFK